MFKQLSILAVLFVSTACTGTAMKPVYTKSQVQPVKVARNGSDEISITYRVFPESSYYSNGIDFTKGDGAIRIVIDRCKVGDTCAPMAKSVIPLDDRWEAEVHVPYRGEKVFVVHADGEEQIYP